MRICVFAKGLPVHIQGGMEQHIGDLVSGLTKRGHEVVIITTKHPEGIKKEEYNNLKIFYAEGKPLKYTERFYYESAVLFNELNKKKRFDIVHSQSSAGFGFVKYGKARLPIVVTLHGTLLNEVKSAINSKSFKGYITAFYLSLRRLIDRSDKILLNKANKIIAVNNELKRDVIAQYNVPEEKIVVVPNGIDTNKFKPMNIGDLKERLGLVNSKVILSVGRIEKQKGFHLLLKILPEILREHKESKLVIVGTGSYLQNLKKMAVKLNVRDNVIFTGRVSDKELPKYYNLADVFAFPTLRVEGLPLVILEAMACEKGVVASRIGGIPTVVESEKDGFLTRPNDLKDLKSKILMLLVDEKIAKKIGKSARRKIVEKFSIDRMVEDTVTVYEEVLK